MNRFFSEIHSRSLLLNSTYEPLKIVPWQKAMVLYFQGKVEVLDFHSVSVRSANAAHSLPSILKLKAFVRPRCFGTVRFCRENVYIRDKYTCQYCGFQFALKKLTLDHVIPASKSGLKVWTNVVTACRDCNQRKGNLTPLSAGMPLLTIPKAPNWLPASDLITDVSRIPRAWLQYLHLFDLPTLNRKSPESELVHCGDGF